MTRALFLLACLAFTACSSIDSPADDAPDTAGGSAGASGSAGTGGSGQGGAGGNGGNGGNAGSGAAGNAGSGGNAGGGQAGSGPAGNAGSGGNAGGGAGNAGSGGNAGDAGGGSAGGDAGGGGMSGAFALTSAGVMEGAAFPAIYTCAGQNISPPLGWTGAPAGAKSYAIVLTDTTIQLIHWVLWDIPAAVAATPEGVETKAAPADPAGAIQAKSYDNSTFGYLGPCPSGKLHTYQFALHALDTATLPGVTSASTRAQVEAAILPHSLGKVTLTGTSDASK